MFSRLARLSATLFVCTLLVLLTEPTPAFSSTSSCEGFTEYFCLDPEEGDDVCSSKSEMDHYCQVNCGSGWHADWCDEPPALLCEPDQYELACHT